MTHAADLYLETRQRVIATTKQLDPELAVPACADWTVRDVIALSRDG